MYTVDAFAARTREFITTYLDVSAWAVQKDDKIDHKGQVKTIATETTGTKWTTVTFVEGGRREIPKDESVRVGRPTETKESREAGVRLWANVRLQERTDKARGWSRAARAAKSIARRTDEGQDFSYTDINALLKGQAEDQVDRMWLWEVDHNEDAEKDLLSLHDDFLVALRERAYSRTRYNDPTSRSSSVTSNLMDDVEVAAIVNYIEDFRYKI